MTPQATIHVRSADSGDVIRFKQGGAVFHRKAVVSQNAFQDGLNVSHDQFRTSSEYYLVASQIQRLHCRNQAVFVREFIIEIQAGAQPIVRKETEILT